MRHKLRHTIAYVSKGLKFETIVSFEIDFVMHWKAGLSSFLLLSVY